MDALDNTLINQLQTLLQSANPELAKSAWSGTSGDAMSTVKLLKELVQDKKTHIMPVHSQNIGPCMSIPGDIGTALTEFGNIDEIEDPDLKFTLQLQREEVEREQNLKKQQDEDSLFALRLQQEGDVHLNNLISPNFELNQDNKISDYDCRKSQKEASEQSQITIDDDDKTCVVCLDIDRNAVFAPCAHRICCVKCAHHVFQAKRSCPLCWTNLEGVIECQNMPHK